MHEHRAGEPLRVQVYRERGEGNKKGEEERGSASVSASNVEMSNGIFKYAEHLRL